MAFEIRIVGFWREMAIGIERDWAKSGSVFRTAHGGSGAHKAIYVIVFCLQIQSNLSILYFNLELI